MKEKRLACGHVGGGLSRLRRSGIASYENSRGGGGGGGQALKATDTVGTELVLSLPAL